MNTFWGDGVFSDGSSTFVSNSNPRLNDIIVVRIRVFSDAKIENVMFSTLINGEEQVFPMKYDYTEDFYDYYSYDLKIIHYTTKYHFLLVKDNEIWLYNQRGLDQHYFLKQWQFTILAESVFPQWIHDAIFYQIFPERFFNGDESNDVQDDEYEKDGFLTKKKEWHEKPAHYKESGCLDFFGGDLDGIAQKIDYFKKLGVNAIYINPIFSAPSNHKYDCVDYLNVDKHFGGNEALARLTDALHENDIKIILDISINHVGKFHPWCKEKPEFFSFCSNGDLESWNGVRDLPSLNYNSNELRDNIYLAEEAVLKKWMKPPYNIDGWRFDVGQSTGVMKDSVLDADLWREIRAELKMTKPNSYLFAEHMDDCVKYLQGDMWDSCMNYYGFTRTVRKFLGDVDKFSAHKVNYVPLKANADIMKKEVSELYSMIPYTIRMNLLNLIGSHDYPRIGNSMPKNISMIIPMFLFIFPGVPCIYYGDEIGLDGHLDSDSGYRYPMQWDEEKQDRDLFNQYQSLINYRQNQEVLKSGSFKIIFAENNTIAIVRFNKDKCVMLICSVADEPFDCKIDLKPVGLYNNCIAINQVGDLNWEFNENSINVSFKEKSAIILEFNK